MHIAIAFKPGFTVEGIVLQAGSRTLRVAVRNWDDIAEFRVHEGCWTAENGDPVTIAPRDPFVPGARCASSVNADPILVVGVAWEALPATPAAMCN